MNTHISGNIKTVMEKVSAAAVRSGRTLSDVTVAGITKNVDVSGVEEMYANGITVAGENRVQEMLPKFTALSGKNIEWHMTGHLQTNKVKYIIDKVKLIQSVDSIRLAEEISRLAGRHSLKMDVLAEINIGEETGKFGVLPSDLEKFVTELIKLPNINLRGLMCVAPQTDNQHGNVLLYRKMHKFFIDINTVLLNNNNMDILSMGMTQDYEAAIEEGATMIRVGTGIFGTRQRAK